ncbi:MAG: 50S ribosomal protein L4 [Thermoanaerobaculia bacterium]|nr:50S ribosomal protein L4 [Thermoanaerobaculia bacterium]
MKGDKGKMMATTKKTPAAKPPVTRKAAAIKAPSAKAAEKAADKAPERASAEATAPGTGASASLTLPLRNLKAEKVGEVRLPEEIFDVPFRRHLVWEVVRQIRAREHRGTHKTKVRSEVSGSGKKPFKQKGTGRARQGGGRAPIHRHGGTVFGPVPHSYDLKVNAKAKKAALRCVLSEKARGNHVVLLDTLQLASHKTKDLAGVLAKLGVEGKALVLDRKDNLNLSRAAANNPKVVALDVLGLNVYDALNAGTLVFSEDALRAAIEVLA